MLCTDQQAFKKREVGDEQQLTVLLLPPGAAAGGFSLCPGHRLAPRPLVLHLPAAGRLQLGLRPGVRSHGGHPHHRAGRGGGRPQAGKRTGLLHAHPQQRRLTGAAHRRYVRQML